MPKRKRSRNLLTDEPPGKEDKYNSLVNNSDDEPPRKKKSKKSKKHRKKDDSGSDWAEENLSQNKKSTRLKKQTLQNDSSDSDDSNIIELTQRNTQLNRKSQMGFCLDSNYDKHLEICQTKSRSSTSQEVPSAFTQMDNPSLSDMNLINLKPSTWIQRHTPHAVAYNMASYNIDCYPYHKNRISFPGYRPAVMTTPVSRLLTKGNRTNQNDIFLSSDEDDGDDLVEYSADCVKLISPNEIVLEKTLIP